MARAPFSIALSMLVLAQTAHGLPAVGSALGRTVEIAPGVVMPTINLGTCCGSTPQAGLPSWLEVGATGIDTAWDYHDQPVINQIIHKPHAPARDKLFVTTKVPAGFGNSSDCDPDPMIAVRYIQDDLRQLGLPYVDLALVHRPCQASQTSDPVKSNNALWEGMQMALAMNLTRAIGVSNYRTADLKALDQSKAKPAVNQCQMGIKTHDDETIAYCQQHGILYESYQAIKECPFTDTTVAEIATRHNVTASQVCIRWVLERGCASATGTGADPVKAAKYASENFDIYSFALSAAEVEQLDKIQGSR